MSNIIIQGITIDEFRSIIKEELNSLMQNNGNPIEQPDAIGDEYITSEKAVALLAVNKITLWKWSKEGKISRTRVGRRVFYLRSEILDILQSKMKARSN